MAITLSQIDKWMKQASVFGKKVNTTDTAIHRIIIFKKLKSQKLDMGGYNTFLEDLAATKNFSLDELKSKMKACSEPGVTWKSVVSKHIYGSNRHFKFESITLK